jgi:hypothetical protein
VIWQAIGRGQDIEGKMKHKRGEVKH